jgi:hypothetical protein
LLKFYNDYIELGSWKFDFDKIENPIFYQSKSSFMPMKIFTFNYDNKQYQFGFNPWANPLPYLPFSPKLEFTSLKLSIFSIVLRLSILAYLVYLIIEEFL